MPQDLLDVLGIIMLTAPPMALAVVWLLGKVHEHLLP